MRAVAGPARCGRTGLAGPGAVDGMLTAGDMPEYLFRRAGGIVGLLRRLIEDGCAKAIATGEERLTRNLLAGTVIGRDSLADLDPEAGEVPDIPEDAPRRSAASPLPDTSCASPAACMSAAAARPPH